MFSERQFLYLYNSIFISHLKKKKKSVVNSISIIRYTQRKRKIIPKRKREKNIET